mgnify:CR=1 FL=1
MVELVFVTVLRLVFLIHYFTCFWILLCLTFADSSLTARIQNWIFIAEGEDLDTNIALFKEDLLNMDQF